MADPMIAGLPVSRTANHSQPSEKFIRELIVFQGGGYILVFQ